MPQGGGVHRAHHHTSRGEGGVRRGALGLELSSRHGVRPALESLLI
eukprot:gene6407-biopygen2997